MSGWIALSFLDDPLLSKEHFQNFLTMLVTLLVFLRGAYWLAKILQSSWR